MYNVALNQKHLPEHKDTLWTLTDWVITTSAHEQSRWCRVSCWCNTTRKQRSLHEMNEEIKNKGCDHFFNLLMLRKNRAERGSQAIFGNCL